MTRPGEPDNLHPEISEVAQASSPRAGQGPGWWLAVAAESIGLAGLLASTQNSQEPLILNASLKHITGSSLSICIHICIYVYTLKSR